ncbi:MAG: alpha/beta fold hydrolase [Erysipelotrichaceae bacterium]
MESLRLRSSNSKEQLNVSLHIDQKLIKGIMLVVHGMNEHSQRYLPFVKFLNDNGYGVVTYDQLGHGDSVSDGLYGYFGEDGANSLINDVKVVSDYIADRFPNLPIILLGHSMGSLVTRNFFNRFPEKISGYIMMGSLGPDNNAGNRFLLKSLKRMFGGRKYSRFVNDFAFKSFNDRISNPKTSSDWLTRDEEIVKAYTLDPKCTFAFTYQGLLDILDLRMWCNDEKWFNTLVKDKPILILSGKEDPCGDYGEAIKVIYNKLKNNNCLVEYKLYDNCRHEILNELNKEEVYGDILAFCNRICKKNIFIK